MARTCADRRLDDVAMDAHGDPVLYCVELRVAMLHADDHEREVSPQRRDGRAHDVCDAACRRHARRVVDWSNNYADDDYKCVLFHAATGRKSFLPDMPTTPLILGSILGVEQLRRTGAAPAVDVWSHYDRRCPDGNALTLREGELTNSTLSATAPCRKNPTIAETHAPRLQERFRTS